MKRRDFITLLGGVAAAWPIVARAQQGGGMRRIGVLMGYAESDLDAQTKMAAFREGLQRLGWAEGRNIRIDTRWPIPADVESAQGLAKELVALQPGVILSQITPTTAALLQHSANAKTVRPLYHITMDKDRHRRTICCQARTRPGEDAMSRLKLGIRRWSVLVASEFRAATAPNAPCQTR